MIPIQMRGGARFVAGVEGDGGPGSWIWPVWLFTKVNILPNADDHSGWTGAAGLTGTQTDRFGGTTAEEWIEHSGAAAGRSLAKDSISSGTGRFLAQVFYKQVASSDAARVFEMDVATAVSFAKYVYIFGDEAGNVVDHGAAGGWTLHDYGIDASTGGYYRMWMDFTTTDASIQMYLAHRADSGASYTGDGASGWYIDDNSIVKI
jgi:hypothetical protein